MLLDVGLISWGGLGVELEAARFREGKVGSGFWEEAPLVRDEEIC